MSLKLKTYLMATRPNSLWITFVPVFIGTSMAIGDGIAHLPTAFVALCGGILLHIGCNLTNDYGDLIKGADQEGRIDPMREIPVGFLSARSMKIFIIGVYVCIIPICVTLMQRGGWPVLWIAVFAILAGIFYTVGKYPLGYQGWGDLMVFVFFGPVAVAGTYYVQSLEFNWATVVAGFAPGLFAVSVLTINNIRDLESDRSVKKMTLAVRFGKTFAQKEYFFSIILATLTPIFVYFITKNYFLSLFAVLSLLLTFKPMKIVMSSSDESAYNKAIEITVKVLIIYGIIFSLGWNGSWIIEKIFF
ncbi:MAG: 1,4-dihydroxy-2-naphthoate octaprenyltransferase [Candidatus Omnitrophota bacterium]